MLITVLFFCLALLASVESQYNWDSSNYRNSSWMSKLDNGIPIRKMSIIGSHSSLGTGPGGHAFMTQANSLYTQMMMGIRALDIRCRHYYDRF